MTEILFKGNLGIAYTQFYIEVAHDDLADSEVELVTSVKWFKGQENGLCGASEKGKLSFVPGVHMGTIALTIELHDSIPTMDETFEEVVEVSFQAGEKPISLCEWAHETTHRLKIPQADYRVRYSAHGMDLENEYEDEEEELEEEPPVPGQKYLIQLWPCSQRSPDKIVKQTSENASYWHESKLGK